MIIRQHLPVDSDMLLSRDTKHLQRKVITKLTGTVSAWTAAFMLETQVQIQNQASKTDTEHRRLLD